MESECMSICSNGRMMSNSSALQGKKQKIIKPLDLKKMVRNSQIQCTTESSQESIRGKLLHDRIMMFGCCVITLGTLDLTPVL